MIVKPRAYLLPSYDEFVTTVQQLRAAQGITVTGLADAVDLNRHNLGRFLAGRAVIAAPRLWQLAHALGHDVALIPRRTEEQP